MTHCACSISARRALCFFLVRITCTFRLSWNFTSRLVAGLRSRVDKVVYQELFLLPPSINLVAHVLSTIIAVTTIPRGRQHSKKLPCVAPETHDLSPTIGAPGFVGGLATVTVGRSNCLLGCISPCGFPPLLSHTHYSTLAAPTIS